jgi:MFS family permease
MNDPFLEALGRELSAAGVRGSRRERILAEYEDHLACDPNALLGSPVELARQFADELGTSRTRRGAAAAFGALAIAGGLAIGAFASANLGPLKSAEQHPLARMAAAVLVIAAQVAFATGVLAALRSFWRRRSPSVARAEATIIVRRTAIALAAGLLSMVALAVMALALHHTETTAWRTYTVIAAGFGALAIIAAGPAALAAARMRPATPGERGDVFDDLGRFTPHALRGRPWRFALLVAAALFLAVSLQGIVVSDPFDGIARGVMEAAACLLGFAALGPYVGLWSPSTT